MQEESALEGFGVVVYLDKVQELESDVTDMTADSKILTPAQTMQHSLQCSVTMGTACTKQDQSIMLLEDEQKSPRNRKTCITKLPLHLAGVYHLNNGAASAASLSQGQVLPNDVTADLAPAAKSSLHQFPELAARYKQAVCGNLGANFVAKPKIVRIFTSSTFTDTAVERNALMIHVIPKLKMFCQEKGYEFQVVDMRWGVREQSADDHTTLDLCLKEMKACQQMSTGPNFVAFLGQKYGFRPFPPRIPQKEFEQLCAALEAEDERSLLNEWFKCDYNSVPPSYILQPISSRIPDYLSPELDKRNKAFEEWRMMFEKLQNALRKAASKSLKEKDQVQKYFMSVTESEIRQGILASVHPSRECCWFNRNIRDLSNHVADDHAQFFIDVDKDGKVDAEAQRLLGDLKKDVLIRHLSEANMKTYDVMWLSKGLDPSESTEHKVYIDKMCEDVQMVLENMIDNAIKARESTEVSNPLYEEATQHLTFCQSKCEKFYGREDVLQSCKNFLASRGYFHRKEKSLRSISEPRIKDDTSSCESSNSNFIEMGSENFQSSTDNSSISGEYFSKFGMKNGSSERRHPGNNKILPANGNAIVVEQRPSHLQHGGNVSNNNHEFDGKEQYVEEKGKNDEEKDINGPNNNGVNSPLVIHGESGCGKTSVVSMVAMKSREWLGVNTNIIVRYIGTTPDSSLVRLLLRSVCRQICAIYDEDHSTIRHDIKELRDDFLKCLRMASAEQPLLIVLDSLDQFGLEDGARQLSWLPMTLPDHVHIIVSTIPDEQYQCFPILKAFLPAECFVEVPRLPRDDAVNILVKWLRMEDRTFSADQLHIVKEALQKCSLPIFVRVAFDEAIRWKSYSPPSKTVLEHTVRGAINALFDRVERQHGHVLVTHALGYVTAAKSGLTESELEDVLSCDDEVLDDVYQFWTPPVRRIPPLLWVRIRADLGGYLVDRGADGARVITWYHRQFIEAARARYLNIEDKTLKIHSNLSDYFIGRWSKGVFKPFTTPEGEPTSADRLVAQQPLVYESNSGRLSYNYRKLNELPFHLVRARKRTEVKQEVLCNFEFLMTNLKASSLRDVLDNFDFALQLWPEDDDIRLVKETLQLSTFALSQYPAQLPSQLLGRIQKTDSKFLQDLLHQAQHCSQPSLIPSEVCLTSPGGPMVHSLSDQTQPSTALTVSDDGRLVASASSDSSVSVWEVSTGKLKRTFESAGEDISSVLITKDNSIVITSDLGCVSVWRMSTGQRLILIDGHTTYSPICLIDVDSMDHLVTLFSGTIKLYSLESGATTREFTDDKMQDYDDWNSRISMCISGNLLLYTAGNHKDSSGKCIRALDVKTGELSDALNIEIHSDCMIELIGVTAYGTLLLCKRRRRVVRRTSNAGQVTNVNYVLELWNIKDGGRLLRRLCDSEDCVRCFALSNDQTTAVTLGNSKFLNSANVFQGIIKIVNLSSGESREILLRYPSRINFIAYIDYNHFISSSSDKLLRVWDLQKNHSYTSQDFEDDVKEIYSSYGSFVTFLGRGMVGLMNVRNGCVVRFKNGLAPQLIIVDNTRVAITDGGEMFLYDLVKRRFVSQFKGTMCTDWLNTCFVLNQSKLAAVSTDRKSINIYDVTSGNVNAQISVDENSPILWWSSSSDGHYCVSVHRREIESEYSYEYVVWDVKQEKQIQTIKCEQRMPAEFPDLRMSNNGRFLLEIAFDNSCHLYRANVYDVTSGHVIRNPKTEVHVHEAIFTEDGAHYLLGLIDGRLELYGLDSGSLLHSVRAHNGAIHRIYTCDDVSIVMTTAGGLDSKDRSVRLWKLHERRVCLLTAFTPDAKVSSMAFADGGRIVALEITDIVPFWLVNRKKGDSAGDDVMNNNEDVTLGTFTVDLGDFVVKSK